MYMSTSELDKSLETEQSATTHNVKYGDKLFYYLTAFFAWFVLIILVGVLLSLCVGGAMSIAKFGVSFLWNPEWDPVKEVFGAAVPIYGTIITSIIAMVIAVPISFGIAVFLTELAPVWLRHPLTTAIDLLAAIPSIIYGMWGLFFFVPICMKYLQPPMVNWFDGVPVLGSLFAGPPMGIGVLTAGIILAIMIIPYITSVMRDVFEIVPAILKESAYGLGSSTWEVMWKIVLPYTRVGVVGGIMLGLGRALGETMAVTFVIGNAHKLSASLFAPGNTIASALANEFAEATSDMYTSSLMELGLILFLITSIVLAISKLMLYSLSKKEGARS